MGIGGIFWNCVEQVTSTFGSRRVDIQRLSEILVTTLGSGVLVNAKFYMQCCQIFHNCALEETCNEALAVKEFDYEDAYK